MSTKPVTNDSPMPLDDSGTPSDAVVTKDNDGIPYCREHHCRMKQASGGKKGSATAYYKCPVTACEETAQKIKTTREGVVPQSPQACPRCSTPKKRVYCERDKNASTPSSVILKCPRCEWKSTAFVVPSLAAAHFASRPVRSQVANVGDR